MKIKKQYFLKVNFGIHSLLKIPTVKFLIDSVSFTARFLDNLPLQDDDVLILHYKVGNGLVQHFQIIDSITTWKKLGKRKIQIKGLYSIKLPYVFDHSETLIEFEEISEFLANRLILVGKIECPRCERKIKKQETIIQHCPRCQTRFSTGTK